MAFCGYCGRVLTEGAAFCGYCGADVRNGADEKKAEPALTIRSDLVLTTDGGGTRPASEADIREALNAAAENEDEYVKLSPVTPTKDGITLIAYRSDGRNTHFTIQIVLGERKNGYVSCREREGFPMRETETILLRFAEKNELPADAESWDTL